MARAGNASAATLKSELETQANAIRRDIATLAETVTNAGDALANSAKARAGAKAGELRQTSEDTVRELQARLAAVEDRIAERVRDRPLSSLAVAVGAGVILAYLMRR